MPPGGSIQAPGGSIQAPGGLLRSGGHRIRLIAPITSDSDFQESQELGAVCRKRVLVPRGSSIHSGLARDTGVLWDCRRLVGHQGIDSASSYSVLAPPPARVGIGHDGSIHLFLERSGGGQKGVRRGSGGGQEGFRKGFIGQVRTPGRRPRAPTLNY
eukprot:1195505-Prorocentrum_minimum.AAC.8